MVSSLNSDDSVLDLASSVGKLGKSRRRNDRFISPETVLSTVTSATLLRSDKFEKSSVICYSPEHGSRSCGEAGNRPHQIWSGGNTPPKFLLVYKGGICRGTRGHVLVTEFRGMALNGGGIFLLIVTPGPLDLVPLTDLPTNTTLVMCICA